MLYSYSLLRKQHVKCGPPADRLDCRISTKMASQPCGGTIANTVRVFTASPIRIHFCQKFQTQFYWSFVNILKFIYLMCSNSEHKVNVAFKL